MVKSDWLITVGCMVSIDRVQIYIFYYQRRFVLDLFRFFLWGPVGSGQEKMYQPALVIELYHTLLHYTVALACMIVNPLL